MYSKNGNSAYGERFSKIIGVDRRNRYNCRLEIQLHFLGLRNELAINFNSISVKEKGKPIFLQSSVGFSRVNTCFSEDDAGFKQVLDKVNDFLNAWLQFS